MEQPEICVVGACNIDLIAYLPRLPSLGETLHGDSFSMGFGGKGANQAVMAARLGARVAMVAKLGQDSFGQNTLDNFKHEKIDTRRILFTDRAFSGVAPISVDRQGNNSIIIVTGANDLLTTDEIIASKDIIAGSQILVCQLETPLESSLAALRIAKEHGVFTIFNPAPALPSLPEEIYTLSDLICPNEPETGMLTNMPVSTPREAEKAAAELIRRGPKAVVLTLGERGSLVMDKNGSRLIPAQKVKAIDTTGAGDCFVGSLAFFLARGKNLDDAVERASRIAAISVTGHGTQTSFPRAADLPPGILDTPPPEEEKAAAITPARLANMIDHTLLKPEAADPAFDKLCAEAVEYGFVSVCVNSGRVSRVAEKLKGTGVAVCAVIGFPLGAMAEMAKAYEAKQAVSDGATELDMVINIGFLKSGNDEGVLSDIAAVRNAAPKPVVLKVIIETSLLTDDEKIRACLLAQKAGADFVKTSTGFAGGGAKVTDIALMRNTVGPEMGVKASGGIKDAQTALAMIAAGANRIGAGAGVDILKSLQE